MRSEVQNAAKRMLALVGVLKRMPPPPEAHTGATRTHRETVGGARKKLAASGERVSAWRGRCTSHVYPWHGLSCFKPHVSFPIKQQNPANQSQKAANSTAEIL